MVSGDATPIAFWSAHFTHEQRSSGSTRDLEAFAIHTCVYAKWRHMLTHTSHPITVWTDCKALEWLLNGKHSESSLAYGWALDLSTFDLIIKWRPGSVDFVPNTLSRMVLLSAEKMHSILVGSSIPLAATSAPSANAFVPASCPPPLTLLCTTALASAPPTSLQSPDFGLAVSAESLANHCPPPPPRAILIDDFDFALACLSGVRSGVVDLITLPTQPHTNKRVRSRASVAFIHPIDGILTATQADSVHFFPGGPQTMSGSNYRTEALRYLRLLFGDTA